MKKLLSSNKGVLLIYSLIMVGLSLLSLIGLVAGIYEIAAVLGISTVTTFAVLVIMLYGGLQQTEDGSYKAGRYILLSITRFICMGAGIVLSAVMLYLTGIEGDKFRLFYCILSIIPIVVSLILYTLRGKTE